MAAEGDIRTIDLPKMGGSRYLVIDTDMCDYLDLDREKENVTIILKFDFSKTHGRFIGFGAKDRKKK
jgi:hypothetical protein